MARGTALRLASRLPVSGFLAIAVLSLLFFVAAVLVNVSTRRQTSDDFVAFYTGAKIIREGKGQSLYDTNLQAATQREILDSQNERELQAYFNPPPYAALLVPVTYLEPWWGYRLLMAVEGLFLVVAVFLAWKLTEGSPSVVRGLFALGALASPAALKAILQTQTTLVVLPAVLLSLMLAPRRPLLAGVLLSALVIKPQLAPAFVAVLALARQWRILGGFAAGGLALLLASLALVGPHGLLGELRLYRDTFGESHAYGLNAAIQQNWMGFVYSFMPTARAVLNPVGSALIAVLALGLAWQLRGLRDLPAVYGFAALVAVIVNPHVHIYDLVLLTVTAVPVVALGCRGRPEAWWLLLVWYYLLLVAMGLWFAERSLTVFPLLATMVVLARWFRPPGGASMPAYARANTISPDPR